MPPHVVVIDNYDSFTYNLVQYLRELGAECDVRLNDATTAAAVASDAPDGVLLSPGPGTPTSAGVTLDVLAAVERTVPVLGICLGHQAIGTHYGATVRRGKRPMHGVASPIVHDGSGLFRGLPSPFAGARYHSLVVDERTLPDCLVPTARTNDGELMGMRHRDYPIHGLQFHPESVLSECGKALLGAWLETL
ncbi:MAG TPA: aminodeoxychorismate/anthranilate synthase component II [Polyangiaceae bacterium]|jgi:anthranilate synthase/aminodeoxychorismate synthase-like glutamine amidotransferase|nr:aminodeoxychorismate/anthranilate synthase component II [Polyangiaceae bacterium]